MKHLVAIAAFAFVGVTQQPENPKPVPVVFDGTFGEASTPAEVDKGAKGGPGQSHTFVVGDERRTFVLMECESCLPRVTLLDGVKMLVKRSDKSEIVAFDLNLPADTYTIWAATQPGRGGRYRLTISNTEVTPKHLVFTGITAKQQVGTKTKSVSTRVRLGWDSITLTDVYYKVVKSFEFKDIQEVGSNVASKTDIGTAILLGPAWAHSSDKWISIRTADETLVLSVPGNTFQILLTELQRRTQKK